MVVVVWRCLERVAGESTVSYDLTIMPETQIGLFCWSGPITVEDRKKNLDRIATFCEENGLTRLIVDTRQQVNRTSTMQMFDFSAMVSKVMGGVRIAIVRHTTDAETQFGEDVAANRGACSRSFSTVEEAQDWLNTG